MKESICKIYKNDGNKGSGFFCNIKHNNTLIPVLITSNHIIDENYIKENKRIEISLNNDKLKKSIIINKDGKIYTNKDYDITIIEIFSEKEDITNYMEIDDNYIEDSNIIYEKSIYIIQYPLGEKVGVSYGIIRKIHNYKLEYFCSTDRGSSGSPILNISNNKIIGIHIGSKNNINIGTLLAYPIKDFIKKIMEIMK
jgi:V8-like Glu-specific endopeptidase